jgi:hypothetical protein
VDTRADFTGTVQVMAAERIARLVVAGFGLCSECGLPLAQQQKVALLTAALLEFDGVSARLEGLQRVERLLSDLRGGGGEPAPLAEDGEDT